MKLKKVISTFITSILLTLGVVTFTNGVKEEVVNANSYTATYTITSTSKVTTSGVAPDGSSATHASTYNTKCQLTSGNNMTLTLSGYTGNKVTGIVLSMRSNASKGAGTFSAQVGETEIASISTATTFNKWYDNTAYSADYKDINVTLTNNSYVIKEDEDIVITIAATVNSLYCQSFAITYDDGKTDSSITISSDNTNLMIGDSKTYQFSATTENISSPYTTSWSSSDTNVATIDESGKITPKAIGESTIKATVGTIESNEVTIKVYPNNENEISIATALQIAELAGSDNSPYAYTTRGNITNITDEKNFVIVDDNDDEITIYKYSHGYTKIGSRVKINGYLKNYNKTLEFSSPTITNLYTVDFSSNGEIYKTYSDVESGKKITEPTDPEKENYIFDGWYKEDTFENTWDFDNDTITNDTTIYAKWLDNTSIVIQKSLDTINPYVSMAFSYKKAIQTSEVSDTLTSSLTNSKTYSLATTRFEESNHSYSIYSTTYSANDTNDSIQLKSKDNIAGIVSTTASGIAKKVSVVWNAKTTANNKINIYGSNTKYDNPSNLYDTSTQGTLIGSIVCGTSTELDITDEYSYIGIRSNNGAVYLESVAITWESASTFENCDFLLKCAVDDDINDLTSATAVGIQVSTSSQTIKYQLDNSLIYTDSDSGKYYVVIDLGDVLNNFDRTTEEFTIKAYAEYGGYTLYSSLTKTYSIKTLTAYYKENADSLGLSDDEKSAINALYEIL